MGFSRQEYWGGLPFPSPCWKERAVSKKGEVEAGDAIGLKIWRLLRKKGLSRGLPNAHYWGIRIFHHDLWSFKKTKFWLCRIGGGNVFNFKNSFRSIQWTAQFRSHCTVLSHSVVLVSLWPHGLCSLPGSSVHGDSPGKNTGVGCHALLQGIFPAQGSNPGLPHCRQILYRLSHQGSPRIL